MPYRITYGPPVPLPYQKQDKPSQLRVMTAAWLMVFVLLVRLFFPAGATQLRTCFLPDPQSIMQTALDTFMSDVRNGAQLGDALFTFCELIISNDPAISG